MSKKKKKTTYDPKKTAFIICVGVIALILLNMVYDSNHYDETWIVCDNKNPERSYYQEKVKYRFMGDSLYGFYREEVITAEDEETLNNLYEAFQETRNAQDLSEDLSYELKIEGLDLKINTYIGVEHIPSFFNSYIQSTPLDNSSTIEEVEEYYNSSDYKCEISHK